jgi:hypothetical protein
MFSTKVHTALGGVRIRCFYLQGEKSLASLQKLFMQQNLCSTILH